MIDIVTELIHQAAFGGIAAAGFGLLFNCPRRMLALCFAAGALSIGVRTLGLAGGMTLPAASFAGALTIAIVSRLIAEFRSPRGVILGVVGCIPMIPGSIAARVLISMFALLRSTPHQTFDAAATWEGILIVLFTLGAIGTGLAIPMLIAPIRTEET